MSQVLIRKMLETRLGTMSPALATAYENVSFTTTNGTPFQRVNLLPASPDNTSIGDKHFIEQGIFQVTLCYPSNVGPNAAQARAEAVKAHFKRGTTLVDGSQQLVITRTPSIGPAFVDDRYNIPITIVYQADIFL